MKRSIEVMQVIRTNLQKRGLGRDEDDPIRQVIQYYSMDGELLAEVDPYLRLSRHDDKIAEVKAAIAKWVGAQTATNTSNLHDAAMAYFGLTPVHQEES